MNRNRLNGIIENSAENGNAATNVTERGKKKEVIRLSLE